MKKIIFIIFTLFTMHSSVLAREALPPLVEGGEPLMENGFIDSRSQVNAVAISKDGKTIVSGSSDNSIKIWDMETGKLKNTLKGHTSIVSSVAISNDGKNIVSGSSDTTIKVWDSETGKLKRSLEGHINNVTSVAITKDGKTIVSGSSDTTIKVWDSQTGVLKRTLEGHINKVTSVAITKDGKTIVSGSYDTTIKVWDRETGKLKRTLEGHVGSVSSVAISKDGRTIVSGQRGNSIKVWDSQTGALKRTLEGHTGSVYAVAISKDGKTIVSGSGDDTIKVWDSETGKLKRTLEGHTISVSSVAISNDGRTVVSGSSDKSIKVWDSETGKLKRTLEGHKDSVLSVAISEDGKTIVSGSGDKRIKVWDRQTGKLRRTLEGHTHIVYSVVISNDGKTIVSGSGDKSIKIWDSQTGKLKRTLEGHTGVVYSVGISKDGKTIVSGSGDDTIKVWDSQTGRLKITLEGHTNLVRSVAISKDSRTIISGSFDQSIKVWGSETGKLKRTLKGHKDYVSSVAISKDGKTIVSGSWDDTIKVWDSQTGRLKRTLEGHTNWVTSVAISQDGKTIVSGSGDDSIKMWDSQTGNFKRTLEGNKDSVSSISISEDSKRIISSSYDDSIKMWDSQTGELLKEFMGGQNGCWQTKDFKTKRCYRGDDGTFLYKKGKDGSLSLVKPKWLPKKDSVRLDAQEHIALLNDQAQNYVVRVKNISKNRLYWIKSSYHDEYCTILEGRLSNILAGEEQNLSLNIVCKLPTKNPMPVKEHNITLQFRTATDSNFTLPLSVNIAYANIQVSKAEVSKDGKSLNVEIQNVGDVQLDKANVQLIEPFNADIQNITKLEADGTRTLSFVPKEENVSIEGNVSISFSVPNDKEIKINPSTTKIAPAYVWNINNIEIDNKTAWKLYLLGAWILLVVGVVVFYHKRYKNPLVVQLSENPMALTSLSPSLLKEAKERLSTIDRWETLLKSLDLKAKNVEEALGFFESSKTEKIEMLSHKLEATYQEEGEYYRVNLPESFDLNSINSFLVYLSNDSAGKIASSVIKKQEKVLVLCESEEQNAVAEKAHDKTNFMVAPTVQQLTKLLLSSNAQEVLVGIFAECLLAKEISPYQTNGDIKNESNFFGRVEIIRDILGSNKNYLIVGSRQLGKSSVLRALKRRYDANSSVDCYYITMEDEKILLEMKDALGLEKEPTLREVVEYLSQKGKKSIFLIDEADEFIQADASNDYKVSKAFRKLAQEGKATFVITGFWTLYYYVTNDYHAPIKNFGELVKLGGLDDEACKELILEPMKRIGVGYESEELVSKLIKRCGNRANLIAITCHEALKVMEGTVITQENIEHVIRHSSLEDYLKGWQTISLNEEENTLDRAILYLTLKEEQFRLADVLKMLEAVGLASADENKVNESLERLVIGYFLAKDRGEYTYRVPLFKEKLLYEDLEVLLKREIRRLKK